MKLNSNRGGAVLEYIIITLFSASIAVATTEILKKIIETETARLEDAFQDDKP
jgi:hypothetical protein